MSSYAWVTDIHLDWLRGEHEIVRFGESIARTGADGVFITGDISNAGSLVYHLSVIERAIARPTYFVLGNHDFYRADVESVRAKMRELSNVSSYLRYMPTVQYTPLNQKTAVVGHDGWYDALYGDWKKGTFMMPDWTQIGDFANGVKSSPGSAVYTPEIVDVNKQKIVEKSRELAHTGVMHVHNAIKAAVRYHKSIVVLTHFPPWQEAHVFRGQPGDLSTTPWYTSKMMGDMLCDAAKAFPNVNFTVLAGHTHGKVDYQVAPNMICHIGGAEYGSPVVQGLFNL